jgi:hypothetical protein
VLGGDGTRAKAADTQRGNPVGRPQPPPGGPPAPCSARPLASRSRQYHACCKLEMVWADDNYTGFISFIPQCWWTKRHRGLVILCFRFVMFCTIAIVFQSFQPVQLWPMPTTELRRSSRGLRLHQVVEFA